MRKMTSFSGTGRSKQALLNAFKSVVVELYAVQQGVSLNRFLSLNAIRVLPEDLFANLNSLEYIL